MNAGTSNRRVFLRRSIALATTAVLFEPGSILLRPARAAERKRLPIRRGGPAFADTQDPEELPLAHRKLGYSAAYCPNVSLSDTAKIHAYAEAFATPTLVIPDCCSSV